MRRGEKGIVAVMVISVLILGGYRWYKSAQDTEEDPGIPYYSTASPELTSKAAKIMHRENCKDCHSLWGTKDFTQAVPAPALDGIGRFRSEEWLYKYFSAEVPQEILPTRLKPQYRMPSMAHLSEEDRRVLAKYMASLQVEDWYFEETKKARYEKLTGKPYPGDEQ